MFNVRCLGRERRWRKLSGLILFPNTNAKKSGRENGHQGSLIAGYTRCRACGFGSPVRQDIFLSSFISLYLNYFASGSHRPANRKMSKMVPPKPERTIWWKVLKIVFYAWHALFIKITLLLLSWDTAGWYTALYLQQMLSASQINKNVHNIFNKRYVVQSDHRKHKRDNRS